MDIFGGKWQGYTKKILQNFRAVLQPSDMVVIPGDISWGINLEEAKEDFALLQTLPGQKVILKGNHDLWWTTRSKMQIFLQENQFHTICFLHNDCVMYERTAICGTRGWVFSEPFSSPQDEKIFKRELLRLEASLNAAAARKSEEIYCFFHYPPVYTGAACEAILNLLKKYGVQRCFYGHLHGESLKFAVCKKIQGIEFRCVSADYLNFIPYLLKK